MYNLDGVYNYDNAVDATINSPIMGGLFVGIIIFSLLLSIISIISYWNLFSKAGKPGWASIVPIYNIIVMLQIANMSLINLLLLFIPIANIIVLFKMNINIAKHFGKSSGFGIGMSLIPIIFVPILAFSDIKESVTNNNTSNEFNASSVIDNQGAVNPVNTNEVPVAPVINIETASNDAISTDNVDNSMNQVMNNESQNIMENNINDGINNVDNNLTNPAPISINTETVEPNLEDANTYSNNEQNVFEVNQAEAQTVDNSIINNANDNVSIDNQPIVNEEVSVNNTTNSEPINAFNSKPIETLNENNVETNNTELNNIVPDAAPIDNLGEPNLSSTPNDKKICKTCGALMPAIVSICPNCGTDNE